MQATCSAIAQFEIGGTKFQRAPSSLSISEMMFKISGADSELCIVVWGDAWYLLVQRILVIGA
eukprot:6264224-Amphidinium_carterae.1